MNPTSFATLLAEHGNEFEYHGNVKVQVGLQEESSIQEAIINAFEIVTRTSGLMVVEVIAGAASLYGKSIIQGSQIAGLLKCNLDMEDKIATLTIDLKSTDNDLLDGVIHQLETIQNSL
jgi:AP-3 complex subunit delta-1